MNSIRLLGAKTLAVLIGGIGLVIDQATKAAAAQNLVSGRRVAVFGEILQLNLVRNPGAAFSFGENATWVFTGLSLAVLAIIGLYVLPRLQHRGWAVAAGLFIAGVSGNLGDRIFRQPGFFVGHVIDFLELPNWPIFNFADMCIVSGAVLLAGLAFFAKTTFDGKPAKENADAKSAAGSGCQECGRFGDETGRDDLES